MKKLFLSLSIWMLAMAAGMACTNLIVGKNASADGSIYVSYNADSYGMYGFLAHYPAATYPEGATLDVYEWDTGRFLGAIPQVRQTYNVVGNINEFQVAIGETTFGGRPELVDTTGCMDYGSMIYIALQRSRTAREAIQVMAALANDNGYCSSGESFTVADKNEVWIMEVIGKGSVEKGIVWIAVRVPDDCISAHANQSRIHRVDLKDKENVMHSKDVISFARKQGYFSGKDDEFSFADAYCPFDFGGLRYCDARVWSFFHKYGTTDMMQYLASAQGDATAQPMPLFVKPKHKMTLQDMQQAMRDHYEDTPFELTGIGGGIFDMPYRLSPLSYTVDGDKYFNERPISTMQSAFSFIAQMRADLPDAVGGVLWFGCDDANMIIYTPMYCCATQVPVCYREETADPVTFSWESSFWVFNWVANMVYPKYSMQIGDLRRVQGEFESRFAQEQPKVEKKAMEMMTGGPLYASRYLTAYSGECAQQALQAWRKLGETLIVKYNDYVVRPQDEEGNFKRTSTGQAAGITRPGYPQKYLREMVKGDGEKYKLPDEQK